MTNAIANYNSYFYHLGFIISLDLKIHINQFKFNRQLNRRLSRQYFCSYFIHMLIDIEAQSEINTESARITGLDEL